MIQELVESFKAQLALNKKNEQGIALRQSLEQVIKSTSPEDPAHKSALAQLEIGERPIPACLQHIWDWFWELNQSRTSGFSPNPITYSDILAFIQLKDIEVYPWEIELLKRLDLEYLSFLNSDSQSQKSKKK